MFKNRRLTETAANLLAAPKISAYEVFNSTDTPIRAFIEQVVSRALSYTIDLGLLPRAMADLLTDRADKFQASRLQGADWATFRKEFLEFFLLPRYLQRLDAVRQRSLGRANQTSIFRSAPNTFRGGAPSSAPGRQYIAQPDDTQAPESRNS